VPIRLELALAFPSETVRYASALPAAKEANVTAATHDWPTAKEALQLLALIVNDAAEVPPSTRESAPLAPVPVFVIVMVADLEFPTATAPKSIVAGDAVK
jgi:hypothetical protein